MKNQDSRVRGNFGSKLGVILATAGGAVGLGNVWRFPYVTGQNGGAAFILIYILCVLMVGIPVMLCEMLIGRHAQANTARAYTLLSKGTAWKWVGYLGVLTSALILGYYGVVSGWTLQYVFHSATGHIHGTPETFKASFAAFTSHPWRPIFWCALLVGITHLVIVRGVQRGIERASKIMMPVLFLLLVVLMVCSLTLPGAWAGVEFLFKPDFSKITENTFLEALGQAFFSLSIAMGCLCTYASYFKPDTSLPAAALKIAGLDTLVAILSGLVIFPAALSVGIEPDSGSSLIFITLPNVFEQAFGGMPAVEYFVSLSFYVLLTIAALTSFISIHEVSTSFLSEELHVGRKKAALLVSIYGVVLGAFCSLSLCGVSFTQLFGMPLFDLLDWLTANCCLPAGAFLTCLFVGWYVDRNIVSQEINNSRTVSSPWFNVWLFMLKYLCPLFVVFIVLHQLGVL